MPFPTELHKTTRVVSLRTLLAVIAFSIGGSFVLIPTQQELRERLFKDTVGAEIRRLIETGIFGDKDQAHASFSAMTSDQLRLITQIASLTPKERLKYVFDPTKTFVYEPFLQYFIIASIQYVDVIKPDEAYQLALPVLDRIPDPFRGQLFRVLSRNALAINEPGTAVKILRKAVELGSNDWQTIHNLVDVERWTNKPKEAYTALKSWLSSQHQSEDPAFKSTVDQLLFTLALEANFPTDALDACMDDLKELPKDAAIPIGLLERTLKAGQCAGKTRELLPWIERHLAGFHEDKLSWSELLDGTRREAFLEPNYVIWTARAAQVADWNAIPDRACHHHLRLVAMGNLQRLDRYLPLALYLGQGEQTAALLTKLGDVQGRPELKLTLARLTASNGDTKPAIKLYADWLRENPQDQAARWEFACLLEDFAKPQETLKAFNLLLKDFPTDERATKRAIEVKNRNGLFAESLRHLNSLPEKAFDRDTIEDYLLLAESLDDMKSLLRATHIKAQHSDSPHPADYLRMAEIARVADSTDQAVAALREGIAKLPKAAVLRASIAAIYLQEERYDEAVDEAMHPAAWSDDDAKLTAVAAAIHCNRGAQVLAALGDEFINKQVAYNTVLDLAVAYKQAGRAARSQQLFASVEVTPTRYVRIADAHLLAEDFEEAVRLAELNLNSKETPLPADWVLMGDIRHKQGQTEQAQAAYSNAIRVVTDRIQNRAITTRRPIGLGAVGRSSAVN